LFLLLCLNILKICWADIFNNLDIVFEFEFALAANIQEKDQ